MMKMFSTCLLALAAALPSVYAHGFVGQIAIDGQWYAGNVPGQNDGPSPIRGISDISPVKGSTNPDLVCGLSAQKAAMVVPANPGSKLSVQWSGGGGQKWPHNTGPLMTYMASCGSTTCDQYDPDSSTQWFKIDQIGQESAGSTTWYLADVMQGDEYDINLPNNLSPGGYLIRHEIIALHLGMTQGGAEFYPSCFQVMIGGSGSASPSPTVQFPGAYTDTDPGILVPDIYNPGFNYTFPGGPISNLVATNELMTTGQSASAPFPSGTAVSAAPASGAASATATATQSATKSSSPSATSSPSGGSSGSSQCRLQKRTNANGLTKRVSKGHSHSHNPSRVMKRLGHYVGLSS